MITYKVTFREIEYDTKTINEQTEAVLRICKKYSLSIFEIGNNEDALKELREDFILKDNITENDFTDPEPIQARNEALRLAKCYEEVVKQNIDATGKDPYSYDFINIPQGKTAGLSVALYQDNKPVCEILTLDGETMFKGLEKELEIYRANKIEVPGTEIVNRYIPEVNRCVEFLSFDHIK